MHIIKNHKLEEVSDDSDVDYEIPDPTQLWGSHTNTIPLHGAVQTARTFYGGRFVNQALSLTKGEAPLVQNIDSETGESFDKLYGKHAGAVRSEEDGEVVDSTPYAIRVRNSKGEVREYGKYNNQASNQKSGLFSRDLAKVGDKVTKGQMLAATNFVDDEGTLAAGTNARVAIMPYRGYTLDDAVPISETFAKKLTSTQFKTVKMDSSDERQFGKNEFVALFGTKFTTDQLDTLGDDGIVRKGTILKPGDPMILSTMHKAVNSTGVNLGRMSKTLAQSRRDASAIWDGSAPAEVVDVRTTKNGPKVIVKYTKAAKQGDKITFRNGNKGTIAEIIPDDRMPRTADGKPLDAILNHLSLVSRANAATAHELQLGKIAKKLGKPLLLPSFLPKGQDWPTYIKGMLDELGLEDKETVFDPVTGKELESKVAVGHGFIQKLHHMAEGKQSTRGVGGYTVDEQPTRGPGESAKAKRMSGLESMVLLSSGGYKTLGESATLTGQKNDEYWRALRAGKTPPKAGSPFVWDKFRTLLAGAGIEAHDIGKGKMRLKPFTDAVLDSKDPIDVLNGELVDPKNMEPIAGGLFDPALTVGNKWGRIRLPRPVINPAYEESVRQILGLTKKELQEVKRGERDLE